MVLGSEIDIVLENHPWVAELQETIRTFSNQNIAKWAKIVIELGEDDVELDKWLNIFKNNVRERFIELVSDVEGMKAKVIEEIGELFERHESLSQQLGIRNNLSDVDPKKKYYQVKAELIRRTEGLEKVYKERQQELDHLLHKQRELCCLLEKTNNEFETTASVPKKEQIEKLQKIIDSLEEEKFNREERYLFLKDAIKKIAAQMGVCPQSDFERNMFSDGIAIDITKSNMVEMEKFHQNLIDQFQSIKEEIECLRRSIDNLWTILEESITEKELFNEKYSNYSLTTLKALRTEFKRCEELKKANIRIFIERLRKELKSLWKQCFYTHVEEGGNFPWFTSDLYTEDLLLYHEREVDKWKNFYSENEKLIKLFTKHQELWKKILELQENELTGMDRYKNRGGQLLQEEKERNKLKKKIPLIEEEIKILALQFEKLHNSSFLIFGTPMLEMIEILHQERDELRKNKLSARKQAREIDYASKTKSCLNLVTLTPSRLTPKPSSTARSMLRGAKTTGKKPTTNRKPVLTVSSASNNLVNRSRRLSREKRKCRKKLNMKQNEDANNVTHMTDYDDFERNLSTKVDNCRSTLNVFTSKKNVIPVVLLEPPTPDTYKSPRRPKDFNLR